MVGPIMPGDCPLPSSSSDSRDGINATSLIPVILYAVKCFIGTNLPSAPPEDACPAVRGCKGDTKARPSLICPKLGRPPQESPCSASKGGTQGRRHKGHVEAAETHSLGHCGTEDAVTQDTDHRAAPKTHHKTCRTTGGFEHKLVWLSGVFLSLVLWA